MCAGCKASIAKLKSPFEGFRFHDLRHQAITELAESKASDSTIMSIAGHVSRKMLAHYSHVRMDAKRNALDALTVTDCEIWLVETKGREDLNDPGKWDRLQQWCADASRLDSGRQYRALFVREEDWERYKPKSFRDLIAAFGNINKF